MGNQTDVMTGRAVLVFFAVLATSFTIATGKVIYVDGDAIAEYDGSSWAYGYRCLQDALAEARTGDEIRVANGIYKPDHWTSYRGVRGGAVARIEASGDRTATFELINGVTFKGGYAGYGESYPDARDIDLYETVLSGDLGDNDVDVNSPDALLNESSRAENSYHVLTCSGTVVLDGFTVTGGNANASSHLDGGGLYNQYGTVQVTNCTFSKNSAHNNGGGIYNYRGNPSLANCTFTANSAGDDGGGIYNYQSDPSLANCTFRENSSQYGGGGIHDYESSPSLTNCTFIDNSAWYGGGMYNDRSYAALTGCTFSRNSAGDYGGGMYNTGGSNPTLKNCIFTGNSAYDYGGGISCNSSDPALTNCTFTGNWAPEGNALACNSRGQTGQSAVGLINCILWDGGNEIWINDRSTINISYSNIQGGWPGEGNIDADPLFMDPQGPDNIPGTEDDNLRLAPSSLCVDGGDPEYMPGPDETDLDGNRRIAGDRIDMGAYEFQNIIYVDDDNRFEEWQGVGVYDPIEDGTEQHPFKDIWKAIDVAKDGYTILVKPGVYSKINFRGKAITVAGIEGMAVIEGWSAGARAGEGMDAVTFHTGEGPDSVLKNFVIRNSGMAISLNYGSSPTISNITIVDNNFGIAAYEDSNPHISNCIFWNNRDGDLFQCEARYSCIEGGAPGQGNISVNPLFVDEENGDYHLKSEGWRWNTNNESWTYDYITSRCIDAGDPDSPLGGELMSVPRDPNNTYGVNRRINMGVFGGTSQASLAPRDWVLPEDTTPPEPNPAQWARGDAPREVYKGGGAFDYWAQMTAAEAIDDSGPVEYFFKCTTESDFNSGWQSSRTYNVLVGRSGQGQRFRVKARDVYGNETAWSEELPAD